MLLLKKKKGFSIPEGIYQGVLVGIYDLGVQQSEKYGNEAHKICLVFELPDAETTFDEKKYANEVKMTWPPDMTKSPTRRRNAFDI